MALGDIPTTIGVPGWLLDVRIGMSRLGPAVTKSVLPLGVTARVNARGGTGMGAPGVLVATRIGVTELPPELRTYRVRPLGVTVMSNG